MTLGFKTKKLMETTFHMFANILDVWLIDSYILFCVQSAAVSSHSL